MGLSVASVLLFGGLPTMRARRWNIVDALSARRGGHYEESCHEEAQVVPGRRRPVPGGRRRHRSLAGAAVAVPAWLAVLLGLWMVITRRGRQARSVTGIGVSTLPGRLGASSVVDRKSTRLNSSH